MGVDLELSVATAQIHALKLTGSVAASGVEPAYRHSGVLAINRGVEVGPVWADARG